MRIRHMVVAVCVLAAPLLMAGPMVGVASAGYGGGSTMDQWQVSLTYNCDTLNSPYCYNSDGSPNLGGFWGWYVFSSPAGDDTSGTGDAQLAGCGHSPAGTGGPGVGQVVGAGHIALDKIQWAAGPNGDFWLASYTVTVTNSPGPPIVLTSGQDDNFLGDTGIPIAPGHYNFNLGPAVHGAVNVTYHAAR